MARGHRPPPLNLASPPTARMTIVRQSRRVTHGDVAAVQQHISRDSMLSQEEERDTPFLLAVRITNDMLHIVACMFLLLIMAFFVNNTTNVIRITTGPESIALIVLLSFDTMLDFRSLAYSRLPWNGWALFLRLGLGISYLAIFMLYVAAERAFPPGYIYWGLSEPWTWYMVYLFLCLLGVWNAAVIVAYRAQFGAELVRCATALGTCCGTRESKRRASNRRASPRERGQTDLEAGHGRWEAGNAISLGQSPGLAKAASVSSSLNEARSGRAPASAR